MLNDTFEFRRFLVQTYKNKIDYFKDFFYIWWEDSKDSKKVQHLGGI